MNSNRGNNNNNNRRRGRGNNNRQQGGGGGQQLNRIDSRARGNAPQMLEKYRTLAHDAHLNGDRVQEEYFLQFADHYFRVIADQRARQEEQRAPRQAGDSWQEGSEGEREEGGDDSEYGSEGDYQPYERQSYNRPEREERPREERPREERSRDDRPREDRPREDRPREDRQRDRGQRDARPVEERTESPVEASASPDEAAVAFEPPENPFVREARAPRGLRPRREDRAPRVARPAQDNGDSFEGRDPDNGHGLDPSILPPPISISRDDSADDDSSASSTVADDGEAPAPRRRTRRPRPPVDDAGEVVEVAG